MEFLRVLVVCVAYIVPLNAQDSKVVFDSDGNKIPPIFFTNADVCPINCALNFRFE